MIVKTGKNLKNYIENKTNKFHKSRFLQKDLSLYLNGDSDKVCCLYGLRRTGKTISLLQTIKENNITDNSAFIICSNSDSMDDLIKKISELENIQYFFIDEITRIEDFISMSSFLADDFTSSGKKIVLAGTDSLSLLFAKNLDGSLYDRAEFIHTTYISYKEANYLLNVDIDEYMEYGGTLTDGKQVYNDDDIYDYTNVAIVNNIFNSLKYSKAKDFSSNLLNLYHNKNIAAVVNKAIDYQASKFLLNIIIRDFKKSHLLGNAKTNMKKHIIEITNFDFSSITNHLKENIDLNSTEDITQKDVELIIKYLEKMDVLYEIPETKDYLFTQPGMTYCFIDIMINAIREQPYFKEQDIEIQDLILEKIKNTVRGRLMETIIHNDIRKELEQQQTDTPFTLYQYKSDIIGNGEFDLVVQNGNKAVVFEIKHSKEMIEQQTRWLTNDEFKTEFETDKKCSIVNKAVLYNGLSGANEKGVRYLNIHEFLQNPVMNIQTLFKIHPNLIKGNLEKAIINKTDYDIDDYHQEKEE